MKHTVNNCYYGRAHCGIPCGYLPKDYCPLYDADTTECKGRMVTGSQRCFAYRCPGCNLWEDKDNPMDIDDI